MTTSRHRHAFVVPAYGQSPHLRDCLDSLNRQTCRSPIIISTSTPYPGLDALAHEYGARLATHSPNAGIGRDWNFALSQAQAEWATIAHQDDVYLPTFAEETLAAAARHPDALMVMTGYGELVGEGTRSLTTMLGIKRLLLELGFWGREQVARPGAKRRLLRFGCAIPCPAVSLRLTSATPRFREDLKVNLDWDAWLRMADMPGRFVYVRRNLMLHRIHADSETSDGIRMGVRAQEDLMMFRSLWPSAIARLLARIYAMSYETGSHR